MDDMNSSLGYMLHDCADHIPSLCNVAIHSQNKRINPHVAALGAPPIPVIQQAASRYSGHRGPLIDLSQAVPGYPAHPDLLRWLGESGADGRWLSYGAIEGEPALRDRYARHVSEHYDADLLARHIHITAGCNQAFVATVMAIARAGESVALVSPFYFNHQSSLEMLGIESTLIPADAQAGYLPCLDDIANALHDKVRALVLVSPNNPTGAIYSSELLDAIFALCVERDIWLIIDETYRDFMPAAHMRAHGLFDHQWQDHLISLYSFSKAYCVPGCRLGAVTAGDAVVAAIASVMDNVQICAARAPQAALVHAIDEHGDWRETNRQTIAARLQILHETFSALPQWTLESAGAYFAYARHPWPARTSLEVASELCTELGILCLPGSCFGTSEDAYLRLAFANADTHAIKEVGARLNAL